MRLICPKCGAQYEVPRDAIPQEGRDVQCSGCGHTWFQSQADDSAPAPAPVQPPEPPRAPDPEPEPVVVAEPAPEPAPEPEEPPAPVRPARGRALDPSVAEVLREEAEREKRRRSSEGAGLETQPELGLSGSADDEAARRARATRDPMGHVGGSAPKPDPIGPTGGAATATAASRRDLLPDIEEINQTLRATSERRAVETLQGRAALEEEAAEGNGGFGRGFLVAVLLGLVAAGIYLMAPRLSEMLPAAAPALEAYTQAVNGARLWLDGQVAALRAQWGA